MFLGVFADDEQSANSPPRTKPEGKADKTRDRQSQHGGGLMCGQLVYEFKCQLEPEDLVTMAFCFFQCLGGNIRGSEQASQGLIEGVGKG